MNYFTNEHEMFRESLRDFLNKEVKGNIEKWEIKDFWVYATLKNTEEQI